MVNVGQTAAHARLVGAIVKACDRPHALLRCLESLARFARGLARIVVLDDGLRPAHCAALAERFPAVEFRRSPNAERKAAIRRREIVGDLGACDPMPFWVASVASLAETYVLVLEEDTWLDRPVDFQTLLAAVPGAASVRLFPYDAGDLVDPSEIYDRRALPGGETLEFFAPRIMRREMDLHKVSAVGPGLFRRDFWLAAHSNVANWLDELTIIQDAGKFCAGEQAAGRAPVFAKLARGLIRHETLSTSRLDSSAVGYAVDNSRFNGALAEAWFAGLFDPLARFPGEPDPETVADALAAALAPEDAERWRAWRKAFLAHCARIGVTL